MEHGSTPFIRLTACPACASQNTGFYKKGTFFDRLTQDHIKITDSQYGKIWDLSLCLDCGHIFASLCPSPEYLLSLYRRVKDPQYEEEAAGRAENFLQILSRLEKIVPEKGPLFDVGAATGILLHLARRRGWEPDGIEPSAWAVGVAQEKYHLRVRQGFFEGAALPENHYPAVTMVDFIEHTPTPFAALSQAHKILRPRGKLCLVTPDIHSLVARLAGRRWWHFRPGHLAYFSRSSLLAILRRAGFSLIQEERYAWTFSLHYLLSRKAGSWPLLQSPFFSSFLKKIPLKLALGDSFEIYARKESRL